MKNESIIRVVLADDHPVVRLGIRNLLSGDAGIELIREVPDGRAAIRSMTEQRPDILLLDHGMPGFSGLDVLRTLSELALPVKTILLTAGVDQPTLVAAVKLGARGVVLKDSAPQDICQAIYAVHSGHLWFPESVIGGVLAAINSAVTAQRTEHANPYGLTARERQIIVAVVEGCTNKDVAAKLVIAEDTVKRHMTNIFNKLGMSTRVELAMFAVAHGLADTAIHR